MRKRGLLLAAICAVGVSCTSHAAPDTDVAAWQQQAQRVTITRDDWGIAHVHGKTDADAVFGMIYAQAEDDFNRVETNYLNSMGRLAEAEGEGQVYRDLRMKLYIDPADMKAQYQKAPDWLKALMNAWADGLNFYLHTHPQVKPRVIARFAPWMALSFSEGSIGGDIERINVKQLEAFYGKPAPTQAALDLPAAEHAAAGGGLSYPVEPTGSNGIAIAPSNTTSHHALLWINPHTSFYFRSELQMASDEGLDAYGAVTWGQFFVYQGFNERAGWMHTSSGVDNIDEYMETVTRKGDGYVYRYGSEERPVISSQITVPYKTSTGLAKKEFTVYRTQHGPVVREADGKWISVALMQAPLNALIQSYSRMKAKGYKDFRQTMELHTNSSNNTLFADADGTIAYLHSNFIPNRDPKFDWTKPVDGSDPATDWHGVLSFDQTPNVVNPPGGWAYNSNNWPWSAAGPDSPKRADFPAYVERGTEESPRGLHALRVLPGKKDFAPDSLIAAAFDSYLPAFDTLLPPLFAAYDTAPASNPRKAKVAEQIAALRNWDRRWSVSSVPTSLAVFWAEELGRRVGPDARKAGMSPDDYAAAKASADQRLDALAAASDQLASDFGSWKTPWGDINRFQRLNDAIESTFDDTKPSFPVGFTSSRWGSLASFGARAYPNTKKWYGTSGNSFVAVVEFGDKVRARAVTAGGESGNPASPHFKDEVERYATGNLREVYYYRDQLKGHTEREYHPGS
ncbi:MAG TPA: penicillin acylase family protein [Vicinamibacterales bacterium]|nr:penicillin acylase family protein [Vicinamibacterales bacterium]